MSKAVSTRWEVPQLLTKLATLGWGVFHGPENAGIVRTLRGLADRLDYKTGMGDATLFQVADAAGLSKRWTRRCLNILERCGVVTWHRGGVVAGKQVPSFFRISKRKLVALIKAARRSAEARWDRRNRETARRLAGTNPKQTFPKKSENTRHTGSAGGTDSPPDPPKGGGNNTLIPPHEETLNIPVTLARTKVDKRTPANAGATLGIAARVRAAVQNVTERIHADKATEEAERLRAIDGLSSKERLLADIRKRKAEAEHERRFGRKKVGVL